MELVISEHGTGLHLCAGRPPVLEISGQLHAVEGPPLTADDPLRMLHEIEPPGALFEFEGLGLLSFERVFKSALQRGHSVQVMAFREAGQVRLELRPGGAG